MKMKTLSKFLIIPAASRIALWAGIALSAWLLPHSSGGRDNSLHPSRTYLIRVQPGITGNWSHRPSGHISRPGLSMLCTRSPSGASSYYAQTRVKKYSTGLHPVNLIALGANVFFILLHFVQTQIWYDGLAQDVSIFSSQGSVILMLVAILLMENKRRGLFWGKKVPLGKRVLSFVRKYHGYLFAWATVYTFWYHPMENTVGHLIGFFYMFLLLIAGQPIPDPHPCQ